MNRIAELRKTNHLTQQELADRIHKTKSVVSRYENESMGFDVDTIHMLCDLFDCSADYLLGRSSLIKFDLSEAEATLINQFRSLSSAGKEFILHSMEITTLAHTQKSGDVSSMEAVE